MAASALHDLCESMHVQLENQQRSAEKDAIRHRTYVSLMAQKHDQLSAEAANASAEAANARAQALDSEKRGKDQTVRREAVLKWRLAQAEEQAAKVEPLLRRLEEIQALLSDTQGRMLLAHGNSAAVERERQRIEREGLRDKQILADTRVWIASGIASGIASRAAQVQQYQQHQQHQHQQHQQHQQQHQQQQKLKEREMEREAEKQADISRQQEEKQAQRARVADLKRQGDIEAAEAAAAHWRASAERAGDRGHSVLAHLSASRGAVEFMLSRLASAQSLEELTDLSHTLFDVKARMLAAEEDMEALEALKPPATPDKALRGTLTRFSGRIKTKPAPEAQAGSGAPAKRAWVRT